MDQTIKNSNLGDLRWGHTRDCDDAAFTSAVGAYPNASWCGALDMAGNVWEWVMDWYDKDYYRSTPAADPQGPATGGQRVIRGGSWMDTPMDCRTSKRGNLKPDARLANVGFRVVAAPPAPKAP